jgi:hypothetical protein
MDERFPYGYDADAYVEKALEKLKITYPWAARELFRKNWRYAVEEENGRHVYVSYFAWSKKDIERFVRGGDADEFIDSIVDDQRSWIESANPVAEKFAVPFGGVNAHGWHLEGYEFRRHVLGGYSAWVQAGDRNTGGSRTFFIPPVFFDGTYEEFLDRYCGLVPGAAFGLGREDLENVPGLKVFLGF